MATQNELKKSAFGASGPVINEDGTIDNALTLNDLLTLLGGLTVSDAYPVFQYSGGPAGFYISGARAGAGNVFLQMKGARGTIASPTIVSNGDSVAALYGSGYDGAAYRINTALLFVVDGAPGSSDMPGKLRFQVAADGGITLTTALDIRQNLLAEFKGGLTVTKATVLGVSALTDGANIATDASLGNNFTVTLGGNRTMDTPTNPTNRQRILYSIRQDATGSRTLSWASGFRFSTTRPSPTLSTAANKVDYVEFIYNSTDSKWDVINIDLGH